MGDVRLTLAMNDYDHVRDLTTGRVRVEGIELTYLQLSVQEIFYRFSNALEWDISEMSMGKYCSMLSRDDPPITGIPVFPCRMFRQSSIYVRRGGPVSGPSDLAGKRIGIPEWSQTATIYTRAWIAHQVGIPLTEIEWVQGGGDEPGRVEMARLDVPEGIRISRVSERSLTEMLLAGDLDALINAHPPKAFEDGNPEIERLFPDYMRVEQTYFRETGIFPIMHTVAIRREVFEEHPWVAMNLMTAFEEAKQRSVKRILDMSSSQIASPWGGVHAAKAGRMLFGDGDYWPYGVEPNRSTLEAFLQYCYEQGVCARRLTLEELYPREVQTVFKV